MTNFSQALTLQAAATSSGPTRPAAITSAYNQVFFDDFTSNTLATSYAQAATNGVNWYWGANDTAVGATINTTLLPSQVSNGGSGTVASGSGSVGILQLNPSSNFGKGDNGGGLLVTIPGGWYNTSPNTNPSSIPSIGCWKHGYFEALMQFSTSPSSPQEANGWPAFWGWSVEGLPGFGYGSVGGILGGSDDTEVDIMESYGGIFNNPLNQAGWAVHYPGGQSGVAGGNANIDSNWHTYGCLWASTGTNQGSLSFYYDNVQIGASVTVGPNTNSTVSSVFESQHMFLALNTGVGWLTNVDWVRVWQ
jgi:hypothetical protein